MSEYGGVTVTNNIENVFKEICEAESISAKRMTVIYQDSDSTWNMWDKKNRWIATDFSTFNDCISILRSK